MPVLLEGTPQIVITKIINMFYKYKKQILDLKKKQESQVQLLKQKQKSDEAAKRLQEEIQFIKAQKVESHLGFDYLYILCPFMFTLCATFFPHRFNCNIR